VPFDTPAITSRAVPSRTAAAQRTGSGIVGAWRLPGWFRRMRDARTLQALEPRLARDIGAIPVRSPPAGFVVDPRPLWGIGLVPQPTNAHPPWRRGD